MFRREAVAALDDPDRLGTALRLVPPPNRWALAAMVLLVASAVLGAAVVRVPVVVAAQGISLGPSGTLGQVVTAQYEGRVVLVAKHAGDAVVAGEVVAVLVNQGLVNERLLATEELAQTEGDLERVTQIQQQAEAAFEALQTRQQANIKESVSFLKERLKVLNGIAAGNETLKRTGMVTADRVLQVQNEVASAREQLSAKQTALFTAEVEALDRSGKYQREIQQLQGTLGNVSRRLAALDDKMAKTFVVRADTSGRVVEVSIDKGDLVRFGTPVLTVEPEMADGGGLTAGVLLSLSEGKRVKPGMYAAVDVTSVRKEVYGTVEGRVRSVADQPATPEGLRRILRNDDLVRKLTTSGPGYFVTIDLTRAPGTASGYRWTSSEGPDATLTTGTSVLAEIAVERVPVLSLLMPAVKRLLAGPAPSAREAAQPW